MKLKIINNNFVQFHKFALLQMQIFSNILDSFKLWKFLNCNMKAMAKDKNVNIAVTLSGLLLTVMLIVIILIVEEPDFSSLARNDLQRQSFFLWEHF
jgi:hypothetical protein